MLHSNTWRNPHDINNRCSVILSAEECGARVGTTKLGDGDDEWHNANTDGRLLFGRSDKPGAGVVGTVAATYPVHSSIYSVAGFKLGSGCQLQAQVTEYEY